MSNEEKAQEEWYAVLRWAIDEEERVTERLKKEGKYIPGLDGDNKPYAHISKEMNMKLKEIKEKYGLMKQK